MSIPATSVYVYIGDRLTALELIGAHCRPIFRDDGKCIISQRMSTQLVLFDGESIPRVVLRRRLRKVQ